MNNEKIARLLRVFGPFIVLFIALTLVNNWIADGFLGEQVSTPEPAQVPATIVTSESSQAVEIERPPVATAIPFATEEAIEIVEPTAVALPSLLPGEVADLAGPPSGSNFSLARPVTFYWYPKMPLLEKQAFGLFLVQNQADMLLDTLSEPNLGKGFHITIEPDQHDIPEGTYFWEVRLVEGSDTNSLGSSGQRLITFMKQAR